METLYSTEWWTKEPWTHGGFHYWMEAVADGWKRGLRADVLQRWLKYPKDATQLKLHIINKPTPTAQKIFVKLIGDTLRCSNDKDTIGFCKRIQKLLMSKMDFSKEQILWVEAETK